MKGANLLPTNVKWLSQKEEMPLLSSAELRVPRVSSENAWKVFEKGLDESALWVCLWLKINGLSVTQQKGRQEDSRRRKRPLCLEKKQQRNRGWKVHIMWGWNGKFLYFGCIWGPPLQSFNANDNPTVPSVLLRPRPRPGVITRKPSPSWMTSLSLWDLARHLAISSKAELLDRWPEW